MQLTRRGFLVGGAAGGGLLAAWLLVPRSYSSPLRAKDNEAAFGAWLRIGRDGVVTVAVPQMEHGQGVTTLLPQIAAIELGADWRQVAAEPAPVSGAYANFPLAARWASLWEPVLPVFADEPDDLLLRRWAQDNRFAVTAEGTTLAAYEQPLREASALARALLSMAAAQRWGVAWEECEAAGGFISHGDNRASFAELAEDAAKLTPPDAPPLRSDPPRDTAPPFTSDDTRELSFPRLDLPSKVDGTFQFAGDVRLPGMVYAAVRHGPVDQAELSRFDDKAAHGFKGYVGAVKGKRWLAAVATSWWTAERALKAMAPRFTCKTPVNSARMEELLDRGGRSGPRHRLAQVGDPDQVLEQPTLSLRYDCEAVTHATLETSSCTARLEGGRLELWLASQAPEQARIAVARALKMDLTDVIVYPMPAGGSFDRRLEYDHAVEAALIAREMGRPVMLMWSRWQEQIMARPRAPAAAAIAAKITQSGQIIGLRSRIAMPPTALEFGRRLFADHTSWAAIEAVSGRADAMAVEGLFPPYAIPAMAVDHVPVALPLPTGRMQGNAHGYSCFIVESFIDEVAIRFAQEPLSYRISMLGGDARLAHCLQSAARQGQWGGGVPGSGQGIACHRIITPYGEGRIALVATATRSTSGIEVQRIAATLDIGRVINRDITLQQVETGIMFGMGLALGAGLSFEKGLPQQSTLASLRLPKLSQTPDITIELVESDADPFDPSDLAMAPVAPALANALFSATSVRHRRLPLLSVTL